ncbi:MAG: hypothetical protein IPN09_09255 [Bacteroidetes bacterium]|nr:hypothetical protein [Bacteroidota bacterium]
MDKLYSDILVKQDMESINVLTRFCLDKEYCHMYQAIDSVIIQIESYPDDSIWDVKVSWNYLRENSKSELVVLNIKSNHEELKKICND